MEFFLGGWPTVSYVYLRKKNQLFTLKLTQNIYIIIASFMSITAYTIILWSMKYQPIAYVASIRESSIIMASLIGFIFLKEKFTSIKFFSATMFFVGVYCIYNF